MTRLSFLGACGTVTGSKFLIESGSRRLLVDCGIFQGSSELKQKNWARPEFDTGSIDAVVLTHAHIDHTGYVPRLAKLGFRGPVYATPSTVDLLGVLWPDAAHLHEEDARYANRRGYSRHKPALPFFDEKESRAALQLLRPIAFDRRFEVGDGLSFTFRRVGHILGAAFVVIESGATRTVFSGDVGQTDVPILKDPERPEAAEYLVLESTYGDRVHPGGSPEAELGRVVAETAARGGVIVVPAFAIGRAQDILYHLRSLQRAGTIPADLPIYLDSPMAASAVDLYCRALSEHDLEMEALRDEGRCPIEGPSMHIVRDRVESQALNPRKGPMVIVSASGMLSGGRVMHHLKRRLPDPSTTLLFVGFQAQGTLGRRILDGAREARIHGEAIPVRADVRQIPALSAHADQEGLLEWVGAIAKPPRTVFLVHGEPGPREALAAALRSKYGWNVALPEEGQSVELK